MTGKKPDAAERAGELGADMDPRALLLLPLRFFPMGFITGVLGRGARPEITSIPDITSIVPSNQPLLPPETLPLLALLAPCLLPLFVLVLMVEL